MLKDPSKAKWNAFNDVLQEKLCFMYSALAYPKGKALA